MMSRIAGLLALLSLLAGMPSTAAAGNTTPAVACAPVVYICA